MARDWFAEAFGATVDDIRKRVIEEPWFGRAVTPPREGKDMAQALGWEKEGAPSQGPDRGHEIER